MVNLMVSLLKGKNSNKLALLNENLKETEIYEICNSSLLKEKYKLEKGRNFIRYKDILKIVERLEIECLTINDKNYPLLLKEIFDPPFMLYVRGDKSILNSNLVSIVGTRKPSKKGYHSAFKVGLSLGKSEINVVSGLALGVDSASHLGNIKGLGKTIAILGSGIDSIYPKENINVAISLLKNGGAIISEYPPGEPIRRYNFPKRNRIISGISKHLLVIQAPKKSGSLITADFSLQGGRDVWVHSVGVNDNRFLGSDRLYKDGATKIDSVYPILQSFNKEQSVKSFNSDDYSETELLKLELEGYVTKYRGEYFLL